MTQKNRYESYIRECLTTVVPQPARGLNTTVDKLMEQADEVQKCLDAGVLPVVGSLGYTLAKRVHDAWTAEKARQGYTWGSERNDKPENGPLTHPMMRPFDELTFAEVKYDLTTAKDTLITAANIVAAS